VKIIKLQPSAKIDGLTADGQEMTQLPYPFYVKEDGSLFDPTGFWKGHVDRVVGFQRDSAKQQVDLWWDHAVKDPQKAVGMYLVTSGNARDENGNVIMEDPDPDEPDAEPEPKKEFSGHLTAIDHVEVLEIRE
jgi:hypothetical protein